MVVNRCFDCNHREICKYKVDYEQVLSDITVSVASPFKIILDCEHYCSSTSYLAAGTYYNNCSTQADFSNSLGSTYANG